MIRTSVIKINRFRAGGLLLLIAAYAPGVFRTSLWSDDYAALIGTSGFAEHVLRDGRPTSAGIVYLAFSALGTATGAWILRFLALVALSLIYLFVDRSIRHSTNYKFATLSVAVALCLPSFQMYVHWTVTWHFLWVALAGLYAFQLWSSRQIVPKIIGVLLLVLALTSYPPTALFYFAAIAVSNSLNSMSSKTFIRETFRGLTLLAVSGAVSVIVASLTLRSYGLAPNARVKLVGVHEIPAKIVWFLTRPLVVGLRPFTIDSPRPIFAAFTALPVLVMLFVGVKRQSQELSEGFILRAFAVSLPLLVTLAPIIFTSDNQIEFRLLSGLCWGTTSLASFFLLVEVKEWFQRHDAGRRLARATLVTAASALALIAVSTVNLHYEGFFGDPYRVKTTFLNGKISKCLDNDDSEKILVLPPKKPFHSLARLGVFSMSSDLASPWVPQANVELLLKQRNAWLPVEYLDPRPVHLILHNGVCVIDLEEFRLLINQKSGVID